MDFVSPSQKHVVALELLKNIELNIERQLE